jgi:hypothetical protein
MLYWTFNGTIFVFTYNNFIKYMEELDGPAASALGVQSRKLSNVLNGQPKDGWPKFIISVSS